MFVDLASGVSRLRWGFVKLRLQGLGFFEVPLTPEDCFGGICLVALNPKP